MSQAQLATWVGVVATIATFVHIAPQILRLVRYKRAEGVSASWAAIGTVINLGWVAYVFAEQLWVAIPSVIAGSVSYATVLFLLYRTRINIRNALWLAALVAVAAVGILLVTSWLVLGTVLGLSNGLFLGPSVVTAWRTHTPVGVSPLTWALVALEGYLWGLYGLLEGAAPVVVYGSTAGGLGTLVVLRLFVTRKRIAAALAEG